MAYEGRRTITSSLSSTKVLIEELDGFVGAVGERQLGLLNAKVTRQIFEGVLIFGIDA
jgi:hypothetical protein